MKERGSDSKAEYMGGIDFVRKGKTERQKKQNKGIGWTSTNSSRISQVQLLRTDVAKNRALHGGQKKKGQKGRKTTGTVFTRAIDGK